MDITCRRRNKILPFQVQFRVARGFLVDIFNQIFIYQLFFLWKVMIVNTEADMHPNKTTVNDLLLTTDTILLSFQHCPVLQ